MIGSINPRMVIYGSLYKNDFNPVDPFDENLLLTDDGSCEYVSGFRFNAHLRIGITYILVVTTKEPTETGAFTVSTLGPANVTFTRFGEYLIFPSQEEASFEIAYRHSFSWESTLFYWQ